MAEIEIDGFEEISISNFKPLDPGSYTFVIPERPKKVADDADKPYIEIQMKVVEGPAQQEPDPETGSTSPEGLVMRDRYYLTPAAKWRIKKLLVACGIITRDDKDSPIARGKFDLDIFTGARFAAKVAIQMNNGKEYRQYDPVA